MVGQLVLPGQFRQQKRVVVYADGDVMPARHGAAVDIIRIALALHLEAYIMLPKNLHGPHGRAELAQSGFALENAPPQRAQQGPQFASERRGIQAFMLRAPHVIEIIPFQFRAHVPYRAEAHKTIFQGQRRV